MKDIIIAYPNKEVALRLRALLVGEGFRVSHIYFGRAVACGL